MLSATDSGCVIDAAFQIIDSSVNSEELFVEACSLSKKLRLQNDKSKSTNTESPMETYLAVTCQDHQRRFRSGCLDEHPIPRLAQQVIDLWRCNSHTEMPLLSQEASGKFGNILRQLKSKTEDFWYDGKLFESLVTKHNLSLEIVWSLQKVGALSLDVYMSSKLNEQPLFVEKFSQELVSLCQGASGSFTIRQGLVLGLAEYLVKKGFGEEKSTLKRSSVLILDTVLKGVLDLRVPGDEVEFLASPADFLHYSDTTPRHILKRFSAHALSCLLSCKADSTVPETLKLDADWRSLQSCETAKALFQQLFLPLSCEDVAGILLESLDQVQISGTLTFILLTCMHTCYHKTAQIIYAQIKAQLIDGLDSSNTAKISAAFLLARQCSVIGGDGFLSYTEWFEATFGDSSHTLTATRATLTCLVKFLSNLVPREPAEYIKAHIMKRPAFPSKCRGLYDDYVALAKTRLEDLKVPLHDVWKGIYEKPSSSKGGYSKQDTNQADDDVEKAVEAFAETGKIPTVLIEASIFRKPYFVGKFLPALLKPRHLPDEPDMRMKLITEVYSSGKIPPSLYNNYLEGCEKEKQALLEGIFDVDDDDDDLEEMALQPIHQLSLRFNKYVEAVRSGNHNKAAVYLGLIIESINHFLDSLKASLAAAEEVSQNILFLDLSKPSMEDLPVQVVSKLMSSICVLTSRWDNHEEVTGQRYLMGISKLIAGLTREAPHLKSTLYLYVLSCLTAQGKVDNTPDMFTVSAVCVSLMALADSGGLRVKRCDGLVVTYSDIVHAAAKVLEQGGHGVDLVFSFWLGYVCAAMCFLDAAEEKVRDFDVVEVDYPSANGPQLLPGHVVKQFNLLWRRQGLGKCRPDDSTVKDFQPISAAASSVLSNPRWKSLSLQNQITLKDWIDLEQSLLAHNDTLSPLERADSLWAMSVSLLEDSANPANASEFCGQVLGILSHKLEESFRHLLCGRDEIPDSFAVFIQVLKRHLMSLPRSGASNMAWMASLLNISEACPYTDAMLRLCIELPPHLLFCCSQAENISMTNIDSAVTVLQQFCTSSQNRGGFLSQRATLFFLQAVVWAQGRIADVCDLKFIMEHPLMAVSLLEHWSSLEEKGLLRKLDAEWTTQLFSSSHWAQRLVDKGRECDAGETLDVWHQGYALFVVLLHKQHHEVVLEGSVIRSQSDVFACLLELVVAHLAVNPQVLGGLDSSCKGGALVSVATRILRKTPNVLKGLLNRSDPRVCELRRNLGLDDQSRTAYLRDSLILRLAAQIPAHILVRVSHENLTLSVVNAYIRFLQYVRDTEIGQSKCIDASCRSVVSPWIKQMVDHTTAQHLDQVDVPDSQLCDADLLLFRYIMEKKKSGL